MAVPPGSEPAVAESPQLNHHLAIIVPSSSFTPKSPAYRMARLTTDASVKHRRISVYAEIIEINGPPPDPGQRPDSIYPPECRAGIDRRAEESSFVPHKLRSERMRVPRSFFPDKGDSVERPVNIGSFSRVHKPA